jgi:hypothetical protein
MKTQVTALLSGFGLAVAGAFAVHNFAKRELMKWGATPDKERARTRSRGRVQGEVEINTATREEFSALAIEDSAALDRMIENRPYRHKLDLVSRMVISRDLYNRIKNRIRIEAPDEALKIAS